MVELNHFRLQAIVFALVSSSFTNIYITQPILPVLQQEFASDIVTVSFSVSAVVLGIALSNLPFGVLADRWPIRPIVAVGGLAVALGGLICALTGHLWVLIAARFVQGLFIPALTTCLAAYLAKTLPSDKLNVVMGSYVSATVLGGLGGRLLGGLIHPPLHWRYAFVSAAFFMIVSTGIALRGLPHSSQWGKPGRNRIRFRELLGRWALLRLYLCAAASFAIFSSLFNYLPFRLNAPPFQLSTEWTTLIYLVYIVGIFLGPVSGRLSTRFGSGRMLLGGSIVLAVSLLTLRLTYLSAIIAGLVGICTGFFTIHAAAVGALNRRVSVGQGRANALYVLFYYAGGWIGITAAGMAFKSGGWDAVIYSALLFLGISLAASIGEHIGTRRQ